VSITARNNPEDLEKHQQIRKVQLVFINPTKQSTYAWHIDLSKTLIIRREESKNKPHSSPAWGFSHGAPHRPSARKSFPFNILTPNPFDCNILAGG
jgi:hypothetical protein